MNTIDWEHFESVELVAGTIVSVEDFPSARKPSYKLVIDFGRYGMKRSSAQITVLYKKEELVGKQVVGVLNFPPKNIAGFSSEVLTTGFVREDGSVVLAIPERKVQNGAKLA